MGFQQDNNQQATVPEPREGNLSTTEATGPPFHNERGAGLHRKLLLQPPILRIEGEVRSAGRNVEVLQLHAVGDDQRVLVEEDAR